MIGSNNRPKDYESFTLSSVENKKTALKVIYTEICDKK